MNSRFINPEVKKECYGMIFLSSRFFILEIPFAYGITTLKTPKTVRDNFSILKKCRGARRKI